LKAARLCGLGTDAVREVPLNDKLQLDSSALAEMVRRDREGGLAPFLVVATAGTTNAGVVDPLVPIAELAAAERLWFHVDAAWGGAAALVSELRPFLDGVARADSITFDAHKWLSVPMGAGLYLTRHPHILDQTFRTAAAYMPRDAQSLEVNDPYAHSMQWSRRFIGLKVFLSLAVAGWDGYADAVRHQTQMGNRLRVELAESGWEVVNSTPLPTICFVDARHVDGRSAPYLEAIARHVVSSGQAWISTTQLGGTLPALRACVTNYRTGPEDVTALVRALEDARHRLC
jgi:glutamate/tyrosine decarboxylase-like PLP-dependent enzyme